MTIKTRAELEADFADGQLRGITAEKIRNFIDSMGIGGTLYANDVPLDVTGVWTPVTIFTNSIDSRGITEDLVTGEFVIGVGADGVFAVDVVIGLSYPAGPTGWVEFAITKNGTLTPYRMRQTITAGFEAPIPLIGSGDVEAGDRLGLAVDAAGAASLNITAIQYRVIRG
jgi:hypothetical protein